MDLISLASITILSLGFLPGEKSYSMTCTITVYASTSQSSSSNFTGHAFISLTNNSMISITGGYMSIAPLSSITIGTWGNTQYHTGVWYNLEGYLASSFSDNVSVSYSFDLSQLYYVNSYIANHNDTWTLTDNCSTFASSVWNIVCGDTLDAGLLNTPANLYSSIMSKSYHIEDYPVPYSSNFGYYSGTTFIPFS